MNSFLQKVLLLVLCGSYSCTKLKPQVRHKSITTLNHSHHFVNDSISEVNALLYKTVSKYFCKYKEIENPELIVYGTKSWSFPKQNVNLTLSYPTKNDFKRTIDNKEPYIITGFTVILLADTKESQGFFTSGGILQESISLTFVCSDVSLLVYEFWLYGIPKNTPLFIEATHAGLKPEPNDMCSPDIEYE